MLAQTCPLTSVCSHDLAAQRQMPSTSLLPIEATTLASALKKSSL
jgi:hypothetical protein